MDPIERFQSELDRARSAGEPDPTAHVLATATGGRPSARYLLLKGADAHGFVFFTNHGSRKGGELAANPRAAMLFFWPRISVEVRVRGPVEAVPPAESDAYFASRPRGSRLGAWASRQSRPLGWRPWLVVRWLGFAARFLGRRVDRPPFWGGFRLRPEALEFLTHDAGAVERTTYTRTEGGWREEKDFELR